MSLNWSRGMVWMFCGLPGPKPRSGSITKLRWSPALSPNRDCSKPGSRLPSPTLKVAGALPVVVSTTSPLGSFRVKCRVTSVSWPIRMMSVMCLSRFALVGTHCPPVPSPLLALCSAGAGPLGRGPSRRGRRSYITQPSLVPTSQIAPHTDKQHGGLCCWSPALGAIGPENLHYQHHRSHRYRTVGDIERGEVPALLPVHQDEVHHVAMHYAVVQVAEGATKDQGQGDGLKPFAAWQAGEPDQQQATDAHGDGDEEPALPAAGVGQEAERGAGVVGQGEAEQAVDYRHLLVQVQARLGDPFAQQVQRDDCNAEQKPYQSTAAQIRHAYAPRRGLRCWLRSGRTVPGGWRGCRRPAGSASSARICHGRT